MKLLNCMKCHDIVAVTRKVRGCRCGRCCAVYVPGGSSLEPNQYTKVRFAGPARILGISNIEFEHMCADPSFMPDLFVEKWDDPAEDYDWRGIWVHLPEFDPSLWEPRPVAQQDHPKTEITTAE